MRVGIFCEPSQRTAAEQLLRALRELRITATAYQLGRTWQQLNGEEVRYNFSGLTHLVVVLAGDAAESRWLGFVGGYGMGRNCPVYFYCTNGSTPPEYLRSFSRLQNIEELKSELSLARQVWGKTEIIERAREDLQARGLGIAEEVFAACVAEGDANAAEDFLRIGFSPDSRDERGVPILSLAIRGRHRDLVEMLVRRGANVNAVSHDRGNSPLMEAAVRGDSETVIQLLESAADLDLQSKNGQTALMLAVGEGFTGVAKTLLERGADITPVDQLGMTAGKYAQLFKHTEISELILRRDSGTGDLAAPDGSTDGH